MKKKTKILVTMLVVLLLVMSVISIWSLGSYVKNRKLFINDVYNSLTIIHAELEDYSGVNAELLNRLSVEFAVLDKLCDTQRKYTNGAFYYENRGKFITLGERLTSGEYDEEELKLLRIIFSDAVNELADSSEKKENEHLSYHAVSKVLVEMFRRIDELR